MILIYSFQYIFVFKQNKTKKDMFTGEKVLVIGSGGREHSIGWKVGQSSRVERVFYAPGNGGTEEEKGVNVGIDGTKRENFDKLYDFVKEQGVSLVIVGPEQPLVDGIVDHFNTKGYNRIFGPSAQASLLESDKFFSYEIMEALGIPQARSIRCNDSESVRRAIDELATERGIVLKARGLTGGKGVTVYDNKEEALTKFEEHLRDYGKELLVAERLFGQEFSVFGISDGERVSPLEISLQDHKREFDGDKGRNTGGMGAFGPAPIAPREVVRQVSISVMNKVVGEMNSRGTPFKGFFYAGMMMTESGPRVLEFNVRFGDPECQPAMMMLGSDFYEHLSNAIDGKLNPSDITLIPGAACCVVLASHGYPGKVQTGIPILGLESLDYSGQVKVFHAGTKKDGKGRLVTSGGRVLGVTAYSIDGIRGAQRLAYDAAAKIYLPFQYRGDIAEKAFANN